MGTSPGKKHIRPKMTKKTNLSLHGKLANCSPQSRVGGYPLHRGLLPRRSSTVEAGKKGKGELFQFPPMRQNPPAIDQEPHLLHPPAIPAVLLLPGPGPVQDPDWPPARPVALLRLLRPPANTVLLPPALDHLLQGGLPLLTPPRRSRQDLSHPQEEIQRPVSPVGTRAYSCHTHDSLLLCAEVFVQYF